MRGARKRPRGSDKVRRGTRGDSIAERLAVPVDAAHVREVKRVVNASDMLLTLLQVLVGQIFEGGVDVRLRDFGALLPKRADLKDVSDREFTDFMRASLYEVLTFGFTVVEPVESRVVPELDVPHVARHTNWAVDFVERPYARREYRVFLDGAVAQTIDTRFFRASSSLRTIDGRVPYEHARVQAFETYEPASETGALRSPLALLVPQLRLLHQLWANMSTVSADLAEPTHVVVRGEVAPGRREDTVDTMSWGDSDVMMTQREVRFAMNDADVAETRANQRALQILFREGGTAPPPAAARAAAERAQLDSGLSRTVTLPRGAQLSSGVVQPTTLPELTRMVQTLQASIASLLGVPPQIVNSEANAHAANADLALSRFNDHVKMMQRMLRPYYERVFNDFYEDTLASRADAQLADVERDIGARVTPRVRQLGRERVHFEVSFNYTPLTSFASLLELYDHAIISHDTLGEHALKIYGINPDLRVEDGEAELDRRAQKEADLEVTKSTRSAEGAAQAKAKADGGGGAAAKRGAAKEKQKKGSGKK